MGLNETGWGSDVMESSRSLTKLVGIRVSYTASESLLGQSHKK